jgi:predicted metal-binding protein
MLVCHQCHQKIGDRKNDDLKVLVSASTRLCESAWKAGHEWRIQRVTGIASSLRAVHSHMERGPFFLIDSRIASSRNCHSATQS